MGTDGVIRTWLLGSDVRAQLPLGVGGRNQSRGNVKLSHFYCETSPPQPQATVSFPASCRLPGCYEYAPLQRDELSFRALHGGLSNFRYFTGTRQTVLPMASAPQMSLVLLQTQRQLFICGLTRLLTLIAYTPPCVEWLPAGIAHCAWLHYMIKCLTGFPSSSMPQDHSIINHLHPRLPIPA